MEESLRRIASASLSCAQWIETNKQRSNFTEAVRMILVATAGFVEMAAPENVPIQVLALVTRNVFELQIRLTHICQSEENLLLWIGEALVDRADVYEGILEGAPEWAERSLVERELDRTRAAAERHGIDITKRPLNVRALAKAVGQESEYTRMYKLYSKLVHPTSYAVNYPKEEIDGLLHRSVLNTLAQLYAHHVIARAREQMQIPAELMDQWLFE